MLVTLGWLALALIHVTPALALVRPALIDRLYGVPAGGVSHVLLRHRAGLFLAIFVVAVGAALDPGTRRLATIVVGLSMASFIALYAGAGSPRALRTIAIADAAGLAILPALGWVAFR